MHDLAPIPCVFYRGGTSRGLFFHKRELPDRDTWDAVFMAAIGTPDVRQIDGVGGATSHTSKVVVISPSETPGADVDYLFAQVGIDEPIVDYKGMCGNLLTAVGPFAVDEGLVETRGPVTPVRVLNVNTNKFFTVHVPIRDGRSLSQGDYRIFGVSGTGAEYRIDYLNPAGAFGGTLLPTGNRTDTMEIDGLAPFPVSILDVANPTVFLPSEALDIRGLSMEDPRTVNAERLALLERIRSRACQMAGYIDDAEKATEKLPAVPRVALVQSACSARMLNGAMLDAGDMDLYSHLVSMGRVHQSYAGTSAVCLAVAACLPGTVVHQAATGKKANGGRPASGTVRFGHPSGLMEIQVAVDDQGNLIRASMGRTARRLMDGRVYVPARLLRRHGA